MEESMEGVIGSLRVTAVGGRNLAKKDTIGTSDPYLYLRLGKGTFKTSVKKRTLNPKWMEQAIFISYVTLLYSSNKFSPVMNLDDDLKIECYDYDEASKNDFMGQVSISLHDLTDCRTHYTWHRLLKGTTKETMKEEVSGDILIETESLSKLQHSDVPLKNFSLNEDAKQLTSNLKPLISFIQWSVALVRWDYPILSAVATLTLLSLAYHNLLLAAIPFAGLVVLVKTLIISIQTIPENRAHQIFIEPIKKNSPWEPRKPHLIHSENPTLRDIASTVHHIQVHIKKMNRFLTSMTTWREPLLSGCLVVLVVTMIAIAATQPGHLCITALILIGMSIAPLYRYGPFCSRFFDELLKLWDEMGERMDEDERRLVELVTKPVESAPKVEPVEE